MLKNVHEKKKSLSPRKVTLVPIIIVVAVTCIFTYFTSVERYDWVLAYAFDNEYPGIIIAHQKGVDVSDNERYATSEEVDVVMELSFGRLTITDKTHGKVYEGTYKLKTRGRRGRPSSYKITIGDSEGTMTHNSVGGIRQMNMAIDGYAIYFVKK